MNKTLLVGFFCLLYISLNAQVSGNKTLYAKGIAIHGDGKESYGKLTVIDGLHSYLFLKSCDRKKDSAGFFITEFRFTNPNRLVAHNITIVLQFDQMVDSVAFAVEGEPKNPRSIFPEGKMGASYQALELSASGVITAIVYSQRKVFTTITGIEGELHD